MSAIQNILGRFKGLPGTMTKDLDLILPDLTPDPVHQSKVKLSLQVGGKAFDDLSKSLEPAASRLQQKFVGPFPADALEKLTVPEIEDFYRSGGRADIR